MAINFMGILGEWDSHQTTRCFVGIVMPQRHIMEDVHINSKQRRNDMKRFNLLLAVMSILLLPVMGQAASLDGISFATSYYNQPVSNTGGAALSARLPFGTLPSPFEAVTGWKLVPQALEDRLYYSVGGTLSASGPGVQPSPTALQVGLGYKFHELLEIGRAHV